MNQRQEGSAEFLIPRGHAAAWLERVEEPLHLFTQLVLLLVIGHRLGAIRPPIRSFGGRPWGMTALNPKRLQKLPYGLAVIGIVHHRSPQPQYRRQPLPHRLESHRVVALASAQHERDAGAVVGAGHMQLGGQAPRERPRSWACWPPFFLGARRHVDESAQSSNR